MGHATLLDVFNQGARFVSNIADTYSREKKYVLDQKLFAQTNKLEEIQHRILAAAPQYQNDPKGYEDFAAKEFDAWYKDAGQAGNNSRYYTDQLDRMRINGNVSLQNKQFDVEFTKARNDALAAYRERDNTLANIADPYEAYKRRAAAAEEYSAVENGGIIDTAELQQIKAKIANEEYGKALTYDDRYFTTTEWKEYVEKTAKEELFAGAENRDKLAAGAVDLGKELIYRRNYNEISLANSRYDDLIRKAAEGDIRAYGEALKLRDQWQGVKDGIEKNTEYDDGQKDSIAEMFRPWSPKPEEETGGSGENRAALFKDLLQRTYNGVDGLEAGTDALGNVRTRGISLSAAYLELDKYAGEKGLNPEEIRNEFDVALINGTADTMSNTFRLDEGALILRGIAGIAQSDLAKMYPKLEGRRLEDEQKRMESELASNILDMMAQWENSSDHSAEAEKTFNGRLRKMKDDYVGGLLEKNSILRDLPGSSESRYENSGDVALAARGYYKVLHNTAIAIKSRTGGGYQTPASMNDTAESYISVAQGLMRDDLGFEKAKIRVENGKEVYAEGNDGNDYRIVPTEDGRWRIEQLEEKTVTQNLYAGRDLVKTTKKWVAVAERGNPDNILLNDNSCYSLGADGKAITEEPTPEEKRKNAWSTSPQVYAPRPVIYKGPNK
jgi:hypothetical protein